MKHINLNQLENLSGGECRIFPGGGSSDNSVFGDGCFQTCGLGQLLGAVPFPIACTE